MTPTEIAAAINHTRKAVRIIHFTIPGLKNVPMDYGWKMVVCADPDQVRKTVGSPQSFRQWEVETVDDLAQILSEVPSGGDKPDLSLVEQPIHICMWADAVRLDDESDE